MPKLYALLVGVNTYPQLAKELQLNGPIGDLEKVKKYLQQPYVQVAFDQVQVQQLSSPAPNDQTLANKANMLRGFQEFLGQAQAGDTVLFYYSGHGVREQTNIPAFQREEIDGHIANITAYDFDLKAPNRGQALLSDKELRYLIRQLAEDAQGKPKAHVLTLFDCCHSGENTRSPDKVEAGAKARQIVRQAIAGRQKTDFIFYADPAVRTKLEAGASLNEVLPLGDHVMLAACREVELAWELGGTGGVFTAALLEVLQAEEGKITYQDLHTRILNRMRFFYHKATEPRDQRQTPQLFVKAPSPSARYRQFLTQVAQERPGTFPLDYANKDREWRLAAGALHGLNPEQNKNPNAVVVKDRKQPGQQWVAKIKAVYPTHALLSWPQAEPAHQGIYQAEVAGLAIPPLSIYLSGEATGVKLARQGLADLSSTTASAWFVEVADENAADYVLHAQNGLWYTCLPFDARPLLKPIQYLQNGNPQPQKAYVAFEDFKQMAKWHYLKNLEYFASSSSSLRAGSDRLIELRVFEGSGQEAGRRIEPKDGRFLIELTKAQPTKGLRFELINHSDQLLYCSLAYLNFHFGFYSQAIMMRPQQGLEKGDVFRSHQSADSQYLTWEIDAYTKEYQWPGEHNYLKLVVSKTPFPLELFDMDGLPLPVGQYRGPLRDMVVEEPILDWEIRTYDFFVVNPYFDFELAQQKALAHV
jgi:uncharacterized caspase-like protein